MSRLRGAYTPDPESALVEVECLMPGEATAYDVRLDGVKVWPEPASPNAPENDWRALKGFLVFGSQRGTGDVY